MNITLKRLKTNTPALLVFLYSIQACNLIDDVYTSHLLSVTQKLNELIPARKDTVIASVAAEGFQMGTLRSVFFFHLAQSFNHFWHFLLIKYI